MFGNFIYFIVALLIYATYPPTEETYFSADDTLVLFLVLCLVFASVTRLQFRRVEKRAPVSSPSQLDHAFNAVLTRQSVMAVGLFALNIYGLSLPSFFVDIAVFQHLPTLLALVFLALFVAYMAVVWSCAHPSYRWISDSRVARSSYVLSNISFAVPVLLPWIVLSGVSDIVQALPFQWPKQALATTTGEILYFLTFLLLVTIVGPALIQKFWQCKSMENGPARHRIERLCARAGLAYRDILNWPIFGGRMITAGVMGLIARFRYILVTDALLRFLTIEEIDAVIAHEIGHIKRRHLLFYLFFFIGYMVLSYAVFDLIILFLLYAEPMTGLLVRTGLPQATVMSVTFSLVIITMFLVYFRFIFGYFMRNFERQADIYVYRLFDNAQPLITTLKKIAVFSGSDPGKPNWHHFSILERVEYLGRCETDRRWISRHDSKIRRSMTVFAAAMVVLAGIGYQLNFGEAGRRLSSHFFETVVVRELEKNPDDAGLLATLGDIAHHRNNLPGAVAAYERSLRLAPATPHVLNNLAWIYATIEDRDLRDPARALVLARKAVALDPSPQVWDTLAEACYVNGMFAQAIAAEQQAMDRITAGREYYEKQMEKFRQAAKEKGMF